MEKIIKKVGERIRQLRIEKCGLSLDDFSRSLGYDKSYMSRIESGKQNVTISTIENICKAFNISMSDFFAPFGGNNDEKTN